MTEKELNKLYYIKQRIKKLRYRIAELESDVGVKAFAFSGMPSNPGVSNPVEKIAIARESLLNELTEALNEAMDEERKLREYINAVEDEEIKAIMEMRFLYQMNWSGIGEELHMDRTTAAKKMRNYLKFPTNPIDEGV